MIKRTGDGLRDLLIRHGVTPTMDSKKDIELARQFMPKGYNMSNWISVSDRLPDEKQEVDAWRPCSRFTNCDFLKGDFYEPIFDGHNDFSHHELIANVTHWMPLPEPPK